MARILHYHRFKQAEIFNIFTGIKDVIPRQLGLFPNLQDRNMKKLQKKYPGLERSYSH